MRKNLFYVFALVCSMGLFTACSDDDDKSWQEIPQTEIPAGTEGVTFKVNGTEYSTGSVQMTVKNSSEAVVSLKNVIPGYGEVPVSVDLQKQSDGSFNFAGETNLTTPPSMVTRMPQTAPTIFIVSLDGNITKEGKVTVTATTNLSERAQGGLAGTWNLLGKFPQNEMGMATTAPLWITWSAKDAEKPNLENAAYMISALMGTSIMYNLLGNVTFGADGNITANYNNTKELDMETVMGYLNGMNYDDENNITLAKLNKNWADSPKNLAYWYAKDGLLYVVPNIAAIMKQVGADSGNEGVAGGFDLASLIGMLKEYNIDATALLPYIQQWMSTGIPLKYTASADGLKVYVDKEMAAPFIEALLPALSVLQSKIDAILADPGQKDTAILIKMAFGLIGINSLSDIQTVWNENTNELEIALNLTK